MSAGRPSAASNCAVSRRVRREKRRSCASCSKGSSTALGDGPGGGIEESVTFGDGEGLTLQRYTVEVEVVDVVVAFNTAP